MAQTRKDAWRGYPCGLKVLLINIFVLFFCFNCVGSSVAPHAPPSALNYTCTIPTPINIQTLELGRTYPGSIKGYGCKYFAVDITTSSYLDAVLTVERENSEHDSCDGWLMYLTLDSEIPTPEPSDIPAARSGGSSFHFSSEWAWLWRTSLFCDTIPNADESIKHAHKGRWYVMVETRGGDASVMNNTCNFHVWINAHARKEWDYFFIALVSVLILQLFLLGGGIVAAIMRPGFYYRGPPREPLLHILRIPLVLGYGVFKTVKRYVMLFYLLFQRGWEAIGKLIAPSRPEQTGADGQGTARSVANSDEEDCCRICREGARTEALIQPCACQGSVSFVHLSCLTRWRQETSNREYTNKCEICHREFQFAIPDPKGVAWTVAKMFAGKAANVVLAFVAYLVTVLFIAALHQLSFGVWFCAAPYYASMPRFSWHYLLAGFVLFWFWVMHMHIVLWWDWLKWLTHLRENNMTPDEYPFFTSRNGAWMIVHIFQLIGIHITFGYVLKAATYLNVEEFVWTWDLPLVLGTCCSVLMMAVVGCVIWGVLKLQTWVLKYTMSLQVVASVRQPSEQRRNRQEQEVPLVEMDQLGENGTNDQDVEAQPQPQPVEYPHPLSARVASARVASARSTTAEAAN